MEEKKEITLSQKNIKSVFLIILIPILLTFALEHFGEFNYTTTLPAETALDVRITDLTFTTPFGNSLHENVYNNNIKYETGSDGIGRLNGKYSGQFPYYIKGLLLDLIYPILLIVFLLFYYYISKEYKIKIDK